MVIRFSQHYFVNLAGIMAFLDKVVTFQLCYPGTDPQTQV